MYASECQIPMTSNYVRDAIKSGTTEKLTAADILTSLKAVGIRSMDELAARLLEKVRSEANAGASRPTPISLQTLRQLPPDGLEATIEHRVPQVPFMWNGSEHDPGDIRRFNGNAIAYIPTRAATGEIKLQILDDVQLVRSWLESRYVNRLMTRFANGDFTTGHNDNAARELRAGAREFPASVTVGEHVLTVVAGPEDPPDLWVGGILTLEPGYYYSDLTQVWLSWPWTRWNDQISFIGASRSYCAFWDHINAQGDVLLAGAHIGGDWLPFLTNIGWNDRISSFANYG